MANPQYSIVVVETTTSGVTTAAATLYSKPKDARVAYQTAINAGNRAQLFEKPHPTLFHRNDTQPVATTGVN